MEDDDKLDVYKRRSARFHWVSMDDAVNSPKNCFSYEYQRRSFSTVQNVYSHSWTSSCARVSEIDLKMA